MAMEDRLEYYDLWKCIYVYDSESSLIVCYKDGEWREERGMTHRQLEMEDMGMRVSEAWAMEKTKGSSPLPFLSKLIEQQTPKDIHRP